MENEEEIFKTINRQRIFEETMRYRAAANQAAFQRRKGEFWKTVRNAVIEIGSCVCIVAFMARYAEQGLVSNSVAAPIIFGCVAVGSWRDCQYWQRLNK